MNKYYFFDVYSKENEFKNYITNYLIDNYKLKFCKYYTKNNLFISDKLISFDWDIIGTKYGLYKYFRTK